MVQKCRFCNTIDKGTGICTSYAFGKQPVAAWNENRDHREKIYISYDSTNKNCQAGDMRFVESGHPKDDRGLPVFNYSIAYDTYNKEPLFYEQYPGSIVDISQLRYMLKKAEGYGYKKVGFILDRGYFGRENIQYMDECGKCDIIQISGSNETIGKERAPMKGATSIQERLWELRKDKGLNLEELSKLTGISKSALGSYEKEDFKEINHGNLITLADFYGVSVDYLLCRIENREQINTPLTELHLNDEMVALLKSGRINNRLLCELATHKDFIKFLADIEIYVDGIATMQIQNLNALVDTVRHEIIERYRPGEDDPHLKVLQAAHISDDEYFSHMVRDDLNLIIRDIREAHKKDSESAPQTTVADELKENLEAVENFKGSRDEKLVVLYCKQLGINYKNLSDEEFRWLIRILKKSKKMGTPISQRKKR